MPIINLRLVVVGSGSAGPTAATPIGRCVSAGDGDDEDIVADFQVFISSFIQPTPKKL
jgi:hypothetical protein